MGNELLHLLTQLMRRTRICECLLVLFVNLSYIVFANYLNKTDLSEIMGTYNILKRQTDIKLLNHTISVEIMYNSAYGLIYCFIYCYLLLMVKVCLKGSLLFVQGCEWSRSQNKRGKDLSRGSSP